MKAKLSRRESQLIRHARQRAVAEYKAKTTFILEVCPPGCDAPMILKEIRLVELEALNIISGDPVYFVSLVNRW